MIQVWDLLENSEGWGGGGEMSTDGNSTGHGKPVV